jgi:hypothetical protein
MPTMTDLGTGVADKAILLEDFKGNVFLVNVPICWSLDVIMKLQV